MFYHHSRGFGWSEVSQFQTYEKKIEFIYVRFLEASHHFELGTIIDNSSIYHCLHIDAHKKKVQLLENVNKEWPRAILFFLKQMI